jgi:signal transduction histidine kinase
MSSLRKNLSWGLMLGLVSLLLLQWLVVAVAVNQLTQSQLTDRLRQEGENLLAGFSADPMGQLTIDHQRMGPLYQRPFSGHYYLVIADYQQFVSRSLWDFNLEIKPVASGQDALIHLMGPQKQPLLAVVNGYQKHGHHVTIAVAEDLSYLQASINRFKIIHALISVVGLILLLIIQRLIVLKALAPLQAVQDSITRLGRGESDRVEELGPEEIRPLIEEFNRLLVGIDRKSKRSREALGNMAHALKTRLTLLNQAAERPEIGAHPDLRNSIYQSTEALGNIIERELKRARLMGDIRPGKIIDLNVGIEDLVNTLELTYKSKDIKITWQATGDVKFNGDREDLIEMLGNLLDNACKWGSKRVSLTIAGGNVLTFIVEDDGKGASIAELENLTRRGFRADESRHGSGLGLAIVSDIVKSYNGFLTFSKSDVLGGLRVEAGFPAK